MACYNHIPNKKFYLKAFKNYPHFYISLLHNAKSVILLTNPGCDVTSRELGTLEGGVDWIYERINK